MRTLVSKSGKVGYGYDKGEVASFDEYVQRLSQYGPTEDYWYDTLYELPEITNGLDYDARKGRYIVKRCIDRRGSGFLWHSWACS